MGFLQVRQCPQVQGRCPTKMAIKYSQDWCRNSGKSQLYNNLYPSNWTNIPGPLTRICISCPLRLLRASSSRRLVIWRSSQLSNFPLVKARTRRASPYLKRPSSQVTFGSPHTLQVLIAGFQHTYTACAITSTCGRDESQKFFLLQQFTQPKLNKSSCSFDRWHSPGQLTFYAM